jgi:hypothetical protein
VVAFLHAIHCPKLDPNVAGNDSPDDEKWWCEVANASNDDEPDDDCWERENVDAVASLGKAEANTAAREQLLFHVSWGRVEG